MAEHSVNLGDLFEAVADAVPTRTAVATSDGHRYTYAELNTRANRCANYAGRYWCRSGRSSCRDIA